MNGDNDAVAPLARKSLFNRMGTGMGRLTRMGTAFSVGTAENDEVDEEMNTYLDEGKGPRLSCC